MTKAVSTLRLFVGIYPPPDAAERLLAMLDGLTLPRCRATAVEAVHLTVQFIGAVAVSDLEQTSESVDRSVAGLPSFSMSLERICTLPERGPARLIAAVGDLPAELLEMHRRLVQRLARNVLPREKQRFLPHMTLGRFSSPVRLPPIDQPIEGMTFPVTAVRLMKSTLRPEGAVHAEVRLWPLEDRRGR